MDKIIAYLSHSYRPEDRPINMTIWRRLNEQGVVFAVDPPSRHNRPMDVTYLERMMQRSHCFVAIVPYRSQPTDSPSRLTGRWSPYQELECRLAIRANKPRFIVVEKDIDIGPLASGTKHLWFERASLELDPDFDRELARFIESAKGREREQGVFPKVGVLRWTLADEAWLRLSKTLFETSKKGVEILEVDHQTQDHELLTLARGFSMVVADIHPSITPAPVLGLLHGAAIPLFRTCLLEADGSEAEKSAEEEKKIADLRLDGDEGASAPQAPGETHLPLLFQGYRADKQMRPVHFWARSSVEETAQMISQLSESYRERELGRQLKLNGSEYFLSLKGNRVFISTPGELNPLTLPLKSALEQAGMPAFHYRSFGDIPSGAAWSLALEQAIADVDLLLAFISPAYWESKECIAELDQAVKRWERHQLLILTWIDDSMEARRLPAFLSRYQAMLPSTPETATQRIVEEVRRQFLGNPQDETAQARPKLTGLVQHYLVDELHDLGDFLEKICRLNPADAADVTTRVSRSASPASELIDILLDGIQIERFGGAALGRLCFHLRRLDQQKDTRDFLTQQFSRLRLFSNLHDIGAWKARRRRKETELHLKGEIDKNPYKVATLLSGDGTNAIAAAQRLGDALAGYTTLSSPDALADEACRIAVCGSSEDLLVPVEWTTLPPLSVPLARARPLYRKVSASSSGPRRLSIEDLFDQAIGGPPRVLLFGYAPLTLPNVHKELQEVENIFHQHYDERNWPAELIECVTGDEATPEGLHDRLSNSDYDILHLIGHAGRLGESPVVQAHADKEDGGWIHGEDLGQWLRTSLVRFVYLSCCGGAAESIDLWPGRRQTLLENVIEAGVPEVIAYVWPVSDGRSVAFTAKFYAEFVKAFDAPKALYQARVSTEKSNPLWAASVLVKQPTTSEHE